MLRCRAGRRLGLRMLHNGPETLEELVERHVVKGKKGERLPSAGLTTSRREALALYREILRTTRLFTWTNEQGVPWRDLLRESTRLEYEQARYETDPEVVARLLVVGRDAVQAAIDKVMS
ncbi:hypothetical protein KC19_6G131100 [Ceratodon purpureus]|uniref:Complex 1 LYR protein domain-containing protein n=1 Tax=Ceratodon purpureus TaxID=3225 RepID=A0A8T0HG92_CERPU|nr:hypothetical protein KC19_6G131100 [Ceratodon purpureus]